MLDVDPSPFEGAFVCSNSVERFDGTAVVNNVFSDDTSIVLYVVKSGTKAVL